MKLVEEKVFKDPIHQYIYVQESIIWQLIGSKEFQRLRRIKQLGTTYFTFHGAEHSRFNHSLGVYEITRKIISLFERNQYEDRSYEERLIALIAALLHDIGHGPFSHSTEKILNNHEEWSKRVILGDTEINQILSSYDLNLPKAIVDIYDKKSSNPITENLISSQLDADRMDYLLRDAYYTGVNYGTFDLERMLRVLRPHNNKLVVKESGMHSVEDYLMSRYQMYWQVYFHPVTRSGEIILRKVFHRAKHLYQNEYNFSTIFFPIKELFDDKLEVSGMLKLDDSQIYTLLSFWAEEKDNILADLSSRFINRRLFQYIDYKPDMIRLSNIQDFFKNNGIDPEYYLEFDSPSDLPYDTYQIEDEINKSPIFLLNLNNDLIEISQKSEIIASIMGKEKRKHRLYFPLDMVKARGIETNLKDLIN